MAIALIIIGIILVVVSDRLQPDPQRKPVLNGAMSTLGGILWLAGVVWSFFSYGIINGILLLIGSFILGALLGIKPSKS